MSNTATNTPKIEVGHVRLNVDWDHRAALVSVPVGEITITVHVWRNPSSGKLRVFFPSHQIGGHYEDAVQVTADLRTEIEAAAIAAYKAAKKAVPNPTNGADK